MRRLDSIRISRERPVVHACRSAQRPGDQFDEPGFRIKLEGVVADIKSGLVFLQTPVGRYSVTAKTAPDGIKVSDNVVVDHRAKGKEGVHRFITGRLTSVSVDLQGIKLMTPEGERTFTVQHGDSKLSGMKEGTLITIELNEADSVIQIRKAG